MRKGIAHNAGMDPVGAEPQDTDRVLRQHSVSTYMLLALLARWGSGNTKFGFKEVDAARIKVAEARQAFTAATLPPQLPPRTEVDQSAEKALEAIAMSLA